MIKPARAEANRLEERGVQGEVARPGDTKEKRAAWIRRALDHWVPDVDIPLQHEDAFTLLVAVVLSAQCTDQRVNEVTPSLFAAASTPQQMLALGEDAIRDLIRSCGLYNHKAKAIWRLSEILIREHGGCVPETLEALESLPGVGHKTASVVMCQAFGKPAFPVDTHIHRLARRWRLTNGRNVAETERDLKRLFPKQRWARLHLQMIFFGRRYCPARGHDPARCPICRELA